MAKHKLNLKPIGDVCGKKRLHDRATATGFVQALRRHESEVNGINNPNVEIRAYWCTRCDAYHAGHREVD